MRVVGLSGVGKSRLVHEALGPTEEEDSAPRLSDLVLYAVEPEVGSVAVKGSVQSLVDSGFRAIVVVDRCPLESHKDLVGMVQRTGSRVSLVTIDHDVPPGPLGEDSLLVERASDAVTEGMIKQITPNLPREDYRRLVRFARGFPQMAILLGEAWLRDASISATTDDELIDRIILGRTPTDGALLKDAAMLLGAFRLLGTKGGVQDLDSVAAYSAGRSPQELHAALDELRQRGVVQQHGRLVSLQPKPIAMALAERQWKRWGERRWDDVIAGPLPASLRSRAAHQLAMLNDRPIATEVAQHVARLNGPLASLGSLSRAGNAEIVSVLSEIDTEVMVTLIEHVLKPIDVEELRKIAGDTRRHLVWALEKIAFVEETFERAALLLLELAVAENEEWSSNATGQFKALFPVFLSDTEAPSKPRLRLLDDLLAEDAPVRMSIVVDALLSGASMHSHSRLVGSETHGSRPALVPWQPRTWKDAWDYVIACIDRLVMLARRDDAIGMKARAGVAHNFRSLIDGGLIDQVEGWVAEVSAAQAYWPEALDALGDVLQYDSDELSPDVQERVRALICVLAPQDLSTRVRYIITEMPWDFPADEKISFEDRGRRQVEAVEEVAQELLRHPRVLSKVLPELSFGEHRMAFQLGVALAKFAQQPLVWETPIKDAFIAAQEDTRNFGVMSGYYTGLEARHPSVVRAFKNEAVNSPKFAMVLPYLCLQMGITPDDVTLVSEGLKGGVIPVGQMTYWCMGGVFAKLDVAVAAPLIDQLLEMGGEGYSIGLDVMGMYVHGAGDRLEGLRPQLRTAIANIGKRVERRGSRMDAHHFVRMMEWLLKKGRSDADARAAAKALAGILVDNSDDDASDFVKPLLPVMLSEFAPVVWPLLGGAIVSDNATAWRLEYILGEGMSFSNERKAAILHISEDILFTWAHANSEVAPAFLARTIPALTTRQIEATDRAFHPSMKRLIDEFGDREDVRDGLVGNMHTFGWSGSLATYFALYEKPLQALFDHPIGAVRRWAQVTLRHMRDRVDSARMEDDEQDAHWNA